MALTAIQPDPVTRGVQRVNLDRQSGLVVDPHGHNHHGHDEIPPHDWTESTEAEAG